MISKSLFVILTLSFTSVLLICIYFKGRRVMGSISAKGGYEVSQRQVSFLYSTVCRVQREEIFCFDIIRIFIHFLNYNVMKSNKSGKKNTLYKKISLIHTYSANYRAHLLPVVIQYIFNKWVVSNVQLKRINQSLSQF